MNRLDVNADGVEDIIVRTRWDVYTAHSADKYVIAVARKAGQALMPEAYYDVGFEQDSSQALVTSEGAECVLSGYTFRLNEQRMLEIDHYHREFGKYYADCRPVAITTYRLAERVVRDDPTGVTPLYLKQVGKRVTRKSYCDVRSLME